ncbi:MAG: hypothetical protein H6713_38410 [Myxococcales bacterium]|nr:hypothetical protein [Myxococcales bacterium]
MCDEKAQKPSTACRTGRARYMVHGAPRQVSLLFVHRRTISPNCEVRGVRGVSLDRRRPTDLGAADSRELSSNRARSQVVTRRA